MAKTTFGKIKNPADGEIYIIGGGTGRAEVQISSLDHMLMNHKNGMTEATHLELVPEKQGQAQLFKNNKLQNAVGFSQNNTQVNSGFEINFYNENLSGVMFTSVFFLNPVNMSFVKASDFNLQINPLDGNSTWFSWFSFFNNDSSDWTPYLQNVNSWLATQTLSNGLFVLVAARDWAGSSDDRLFNITNADVLSCLMDIKYDASSAGLEFMGNFESDIKDYSNVNLSPISVNQVKDNLIITDKNGVKQNILVHNGITCQIYASMITSWINAHPDEYPQLNIPEECTGLQIVIDDDSTSLININSWYQDDSSKARWLSVSNSTGSNKLATIYFNSQSSLNINNLSLSAYQTETFVGNSEKWTGKTSSQGTNHVLQLNSSDISEEHPQWVLFSDIIGQGLQGSDFYFGFKLVYIPQSSISVPGQFPPGEIPTEDFVTFTGSVRYNSLNSDPSGMYLNQNITTNNDKSDFLARKIEFIYGMNYGPIPSFQPVPVSYWGPAWWLKVKQPGILIMTVTDIGENADKQIHFNFFAAGNPLDNWQPDFGPNTPGRQIPELLDFTKNSIYHLETNISTLGLPGIGLHILVDSPSLLQTWNVSFQDDDAPSNTVNQGLYNMDIFAHKSGSHTTADGQTAIGPCLYIDDYRFGAVKSYILATNGQRTVLSGQVSGELMNGFDLNLSENSRVTFVNGNILEDVSGRSIRFIDEEVNIKERGLLSHLEPRNKHSIVEAINENHQHTTELAFFDWPLQYPSDLKWFGKRFIAMNAGKDNQLVGNDPSLIGKFPAGPFNGPNTGLYYVYCASATDTPNWTNSCLLLIDGAGTRVSPYYIPTGYTHLVAIQYGGQSSNVKPDKYTPTIGNYDPIAYINNNNGNWRIEDKFGYKYQSSTGEIYYCHQIPENASHYRGFAQGFANDPNYNWNGTWPIELIENQTFAGEIEVVDVPVLSKLLGNIDNILDPPGSNLASTISTINNHANHWETWKPGSGDIGALLGFNNWISIREDQVGNPDMGNVAGAAVKNWSFEYTDDKTGQNWILQNNFEENGWDKISYVTPQFETKVLWENGQPGGEMNLQEGWFEWRIPFGGFRVTQVNGKWPFDPVDYNDQYTYTVGYDINTIYQQVGGDASQLYVPPPKQTIPAINFIYQHGQVAKKASLPYAGENMPNDPWIVINPSKPFPFGNFYISTNDDNGNEASLNMIFNGAAYIINLDSFNQATSWIGTMPILDTSISEWSATFGLNPKLNWSVQDGRWFLQLNQLQGKHIVDIQGDNLPQGWFTGSCPDPTIADDAYIYPCSMTTFDTWYRIKEDYSDFIASCLTPGPGVSINSVAATLQNGIFRIEIECDGAVSQGMFILTWPNKWGMDFWKHGIYINQGDGINTTCHVSFTQGIMYNEGNTSPNSNMFYIEVPRGVFL